MNNIFYPSISLRNLQITIFRPKRDKTGEHFQRLFLISQSTFILAIAKRCIHVLFFDAAGFLCDRIICAVRYNLYDSINLWLSGINFQPYSLKPLHLKRFNYVKKFSNFCEKYFPHTFFLMEIMKNVFFDIHSFWTGKNAFELVTCLTSTWSMLRFPELLITRTKTLIWIFNWLCMHLACK